MELNKRVTYPVKHVIVSLNDQGIINMDCPVTRYAVSVVLMRVCKVGMTRMILAWNSHLIPRRGVPNSGQIDGQGTATIHPSEVPEVTVAAERYRMQGGRLTESSIFEDASLEAERGERWSRECGKVEDIFSALISGNSDSLEDAILAYIRITNELSG